MSQWRVSRSSNGVVNLASPKTLGHLPNARLVVTMIEVIRADGRRVEQKLTAGLCEFQIEVNWGL